MKWIKLILIIMIAAVVVNFIREGRLFHIAKILPFSHESDPISLYDWAGVMALLICAWGYYRLQRRKR